MQQPPVPGQFHTPPHRLARSSHERMWAGVAGGMAEYFDVDPVLVRLIWVAAAIFSGGLAVLVYFVLWIIMPREDRTGPLSPPSHWRNWSQDVQTSTHEFAEEARRFASEVSGRPVATADAPESTHEPPIATDPFARAGSEVGGYGAYQSPESWEPHPPLVPGPHYATRRQQAAGVLMVGLGLLFLAGNSGLFRMINWNFMWPLVLVVIGVALLFRQSTWRQ